MQIARIVLLLAALSAVRTLCGQFRAPPELLFSASFDKDISADFAKGSPLASESHGAALVPGYCGNAVRLCAEARSSLSYRAEGNVDHRQGAISFWFKREWNEETIGMRFPCRSTKDEIWRTFFCLPSSSRSAGNGTLHFWMWGAKCRLDRHDRGNYMGDGRFTPADGWHFLVFTWNERDTCCYVDGSEPVIGDSYSPQRVALRRKTLEFDFEDGAFDVFSIGSGGVGCGPIDGLMDDFKIWSRPLDADEVLSLFQRSKLAVLATGRSFGMEGEDRSVSIDVTSPRGYSLCGGEVVLKDKADDILWKSGVMTRHGIKSVANLNLPAGEYRFVVSLSGRELAEERYTVLNARNPYETTAGGCPDGMPGPMTLVEKIRLCEGRLGPDRFRSVGECRAGELSGVPYLETGENAGDRFAVRFRLDASAPLYCIEIDYPDDRLRTADIIVQRSTSPKDDYALQVGYLCGGEIPNTGRMLTHRCLYWQHGEDVALVAMTAKGSAPAAISEIRVYKVDSAALPVPEIDVAKPVNGRVRHFGSYWEDPAVGYFDFGTGNRSMSGFETTIDRLCAYLKYTGRDILVYPGGWYHGMIDKNYQPRPHPYRFLEAYYEKFDKEGLSLIPALNRQTIPFPSRIVTETSMNDGSLHDTAIAIHDTGRPGTGAWHGSPPNFCIFHPDVQSAVVREVDRLIAEGVVHPSFKGVCLHLTSITFPWWGGLESGYNDYAVDAFSRATGIEIPVDRRNPQRGREYAAWIRQNALEEWIRWRCVFLADFYAQIARRLAKARSDLVLYLNAMPQAHVEEPGFMDSSYREQKMLEAGIDAALLAERIPNLAMGTVAYPQRWRHRRDWVRFRDKAHENRARLYNADAGYYSIFGKSAYTWLNLHDEYWESPIGTRNGGRSLSCEWLTECAWRVSCLNASGRNAMRMYALALKHNDIQAFSRGGFLVGSYGMEAEMVEFARAFRRLPAVVFDDAASSNPNVVYRQKEVGGRNYYYLVNTSGQMQEADVVLPGEIRSERFSLKPWQLVSGVR